MDGPVDVSPPPSARPRRGRVAGVAAAVVLAGTLLASCGGGPTVDRAKAPGEIQHAFGVLFDFADRSVDKKVAVVEDGSSLRQALAEGLSSPLAALAKGAKVSWVDLLSDSGCAAAAEKAPCARATYDVLGPQGPVFSGAKGYAVFVDGKWLVAKSTICGLLTTMNETLGKKGTPPGC